MAFVLAPPAQLPTQLVLGTTPEGLPISVGDRYRDEHTYVMGATGTGKTRFLASVLLQDISFGRPISVLDPIGHLYHYALDYAALCRDDLEHRNRFKLIDEVMERFLFLNVTDPTNPLRINPLAPSPSETVEGQVDDLMKAFDRLFGDLTETRRLRGMVRSTLWLVAELNRRQPAQPALPEGFAYPLNLRFVVYLLRSKPDVRRAYVQAMETPIPDAPEWYVKQHLEYLLEHPQLHEISESSMNILGFLADSLVQNFFGTQQSTLDIKGVLDDRRNLFCFLPTGLTLSGAHVVGTFLTTKFARAVRRRTREQFSNVHTLMLDEFHHFCDRAFAEDSAQLRNLGLRLICAHQTMSQPTVHGIESQTLFNTIQANSALKVLFRLDRSDAEVLSEKIFRLNLDELKRVVKEHGWADATSSETGLTHQRGEQSRHSSGFSYPWNMAREESRWSYSDQDGTAASESSHHADGASHTHSVHERHIFYTKEEQRERTVNHLQALPRRHFVASAGPLAGTEGQALLIPDPESLPEREGIAGLILDNQRSRYGRLINTVPAGQSDPRPVFPPGRFTW